jgi:hypothetical protein
MTKEDILHHFQDINFYYGDCMMYADLSGMLDELIAENKGEWIPVSERLPEEGTHILVSVRGEPDFVATDDYYSYGFDDWKDDVTAWQPLPEPYKAESEEA